MSNEAAERLRRYTQSMSATMLAIFEEALAAERRATVERIWDDSRAMVLPRSFRMSDLRIVLDAILDAEAAR